MSITPIGYNSSPRVLIILALLLILTLNNQQINFPFLITDLRDINVLIGHKFIKHYNIA